MERDDVLVSASLTAMEMLRHGVTCFVRSRELPPRRDRPRRSAALGCDGDRAVLLRPHQIVMGILPEAMIETADDCIGRTAEFDGTLRRRA